MTDGIERERKRIEGDYRAGDITEADRDALLTFSRELQLRQSSYSDHRHKKLLTSAHILAVNAGPLVDALKSKERAKDIVGWIHETYDNEETNRDYRVVLRRFGAVLADVGKHIPDDVELSDKGLPRPVAWVSATTSSTYDPAPDPGKMLKWEDDVKPMLEAAKNERDAAAIALQFDAGLRGGEYADLTVGDISDHDHGLQVTVQGKQGQRSVTLIPSVPYVKRWLAAHPAGDDPDAPLWSKLNSEDELSRKMKNRIFKQAARRADVSKPVTPTNFRKSSASWAASRGMNQAHIEDRYGWVRGSNVASRYVAIFSSESDREFARLHGLDVEEDDPEDRSPLECPNCGRDTPRDKDMCVWCGQALEPGTSRLMDEMENKMLDAMAESDEPETRQALRKALDNVSDDPDALAAAVNEFVDEDEDS